MGLVHISEIDRNYVKDVHEHLRESDIVQAKVIAIKEDGKIDLSIKALQDPRPRVSAAARTRSSRHAEEVHAPERGAPGGLQALRRAQAQVAPRRGRAPRERPPDRRRAAGPRAHGPVHRRRAVPGRASARDPQRTRWTARRSVPHDVLADVPRRGKGRLAAGGGGLDREAQRAVDTEPAFAEAVARAHAEYARERAATTRAPSGTAGSAGPGEA